MDMQKFFDAADMATRVTSEIGIVHNAGMLVRDIDTGKEEGRPLTDECNDDNLNLLFDIRSNLDVPNGEFIIEAEKRPGVTVGKAMFDGAEIAFYSTKRSGAIAIALAVVNHANTDFSAEALHEYISNIDHGL